MYVKFIDKKEKFQKYLMIICFDDRVFQFYAPL